MSFLVKVHKFVYTYVACNLSTHFHVYNISGLKACTHVQAACMFPSRECNSECKLTNHIVFFPGKIVFRLQEG